MSEERDLDFWITADANGEEVYIKIRGTGIFWMPTERAQDIRDQLTIAIERAVRAQAKALLPTPFAGSGSSGDE